MIGILIVLVIVGITWYFGSKIGNDFPWGALFIWLLVYFSVSKIADNFSFNYGSSPDFHMYEKYELVPKDTIQLTTLKTNELTQGSIGLFGGYINEVEYLFYLTPSNTGYNGEVRGKIKMEYCEIIQSNDVKPCIVLNNILVTPRQRNITWLWWCFLSNDAEELPSEGWTGSYYVKPYKVYIPVGSVITKIQIQ